MTTENRDSYIALGYSDLGVITAHEQGDVAYIPLNRQITLWLGNPAKARELLAAAFEAVKILDPDGTVTVRTENEEIHTLAEILPGRACGLDECDCHDAPAPDLVTPPADEAVPADDGIVLLSYDEAVALLPEGDKIHTFVDGGLALVGADWDRDDILRLLRETERREVTGPAAQAMGHGMAACRDTGPVFIKTKASTP
jgi:hypothetical protein